MAIADSRAETGALQNACSKVERGPHNGFAPLANKDPGPKIGAGPTPQSNLATLLDNFTDSIADPEAHTIGAFAQTVQALHAELAVLARHFEAVADRAAVIETSAVDVDIIAGTKPST